MISRSLWFSLGMLATGCAIVGAVLPLLPTTPFLLLAVYAFARSSPRMQAWLLEHRQFGPLIQNWRSNGSIDRRTKIVAVIVMALMLGGSWIAGVGPLILTVQAVVLSLAALFVLTRPTAPQRCVDRRRARIG